MSLIVAEYRCPVHGVFEEIVERPAPDEGLCPVDVSWNKHGLLCLRASPWCMSAPAGRVRIGEVVRGGVDKPDSPFYLDTRKLGEGQPYEEFRAERDKMYEDRRHKESKDL